MPEFQDTGQVIPHYFHSQQLIKYENLLGGTLLSFEVVLLCRAWINKRF